MGANLRRNWSESILEARMMASWLSAKASTMGFNTELMTGFVRPSGSFSQSKSALSASGVGMLEGSDI